MNKKKFVVLALAAIQTLSLQSLSASAITNEEVVEIENQMALYEGENDGGINSYKGKPYRGTDEVKEMISKIQKDSEYIAYKELPANQKSAFWESSYNNDFSFTDNLDDNGNENELTTIYLCKPVWNEFYTELTSGTVIIDEVLCALEYTTVVADMTDAKRVDDFNTFSDEIGDNIPEGVATGYIYVNVPDETDIILYGTSICRFYKIHLNIGENLIRVQQEHYRIESVGSVNVGEDDTLCYLHLLNGEDKPMRDFYITTMNEKPENAYSLYLTEFMVENGLYVPDGSDKDLVGIKKEMEYTPPKAENKKNTIGKIMAIAIIALGLTFMGYLYINKKQEEEEDENYGIDEEEIDD